MHAELLNCGRSAIDDAILALSIEPSWFERSVLDIRFYDAINGHLIGERA
jgi:hypothetical protein